MGLGTGEAEKSAAKSKGEDLRNEPMGEEFCFWRLGNFVMVKFFKGEPMGRGEKFGLGGVWVEDARKVEGER